VNSYAASQHKIRDEGDRVITLRNVIETEKSTNDETDRHMHLSWDNFRRLKSEYESLFDELICTDPDRLRGMHEELGRLSKEVELGWKLKQDQLEDLLDILHHENYTTTGLFSGNDGVDQLCKGLSEYVETVNGTAWEVEKPELDEHLQEVQDIKIAIDTHPCPCVWSSWEMWSECSTTCEAGSRYRQREIEKEAINNGADCLGEDEEREACNADVCCPVNCIWSLWGEWNACPSGCDQHTTRTRTKAVVAECEGIDCAGMDYEEKSCSRERELENKITELKQKIGQCQAITCSTGYVAASGDVPGWGNIGANSTNNILTSDACGELCDQTYGCCSYEWSPTSKICNLNVECYPSAPKYQDFGFCMKDTATGETGALDGPEASTPTAT